MSEEEILKIMKNLVLMPCDWKITDKYDGKIDFIGSLEGNEAVQGLLDLYIHKKGRVEELKQELLKEKEKNKQLFEEYNKRVATIIKYEQTIKTAIDEFEDVLEE